MDLSRGAQASSSKCLRLETQQANEVFPNLKRSGKRLLPRIPDELTLQHIVPKLSWKDSYVLSLTTPSWLDAIQNRHVYHARVKSHSTDTVILVKYERHPQDTEISVGPFQQMAFFSINANFESHVFIEFPPIPHLHRPGIPKNCESVSLDGKIYILGGVTTFTTGADGDCRFRCNKVYALDLAGQRLQWKECAGMQHARETFGCGVLGGKIYVFGGTSTDDPAEVYDPKENTWSLVSLPSTSGQHIPFRMHACQKVAILGDEILLFQFSFTLPLGIYHPAKDQWRKLTSFPKPEGCIVTTPGNFFSISSGHIHVLDTHRNSWTQVQSSSFAGIGMFHDRFAIGSPALIVDGEILAFITVYDKNDWFQATHIVQSSGLGSMVEEIKWHCVEFHFPLRMSGVWNNLICTVQL